MGLLAASRLNTATLIDRIREKWGEINEQVSQRDITNNAASSGNDDDDDDDDYDDDDEDDDYDDDEDDEETTTMTMNQAQLVLRTLL